MQVSQCLVGATLSLTPGGLDIDRKKENVIWSYMISYPIETKFDAEVGNPTYLI